MNEPIGGGLVDRASDRLSTDMAIALAKVSLLSLALFAGGVQAAEWTVDGDNSVLGFETTYEKLTISGQFTRFDADIRFDPELLDASSFDVRIHTQGTETGADEGDRMLARSEWFDPQGYPQARFIAERIEPDGSEGRYAAVGKLSIKERERSLRFPFTWTPTDEGATLDGAATVNRLDYDVGVGQWKDDERIGPDVRIVVRLHLLQQ